MQKSEVTQSCPTLCNPMDRSPPGSSIHGIFQARILEWVAISFSGGSSQSRDQTHVSCTAGRLFTVWATREGHYVCRSEGYTVNSLSGRLMVGLVVSIFSSFPVCMFYFPAINIQKKKIRKPMWKCPSLIYGKGRRSWGWVHWDGFHEKTGCLG